MLLILVRKIKIMFCSSIIVYVSIGNDGSAFVEALVNRSGDDGDKYEVRKRKDVLF